MRSILKMKRASFTVGFILISAAVCAACVKPEGVSTVSPGATPTAQINGGPDITGKPSEIEAPPTKPADTESPAATPTGSVTGNGENNDYELLADLQKSINSFLDNYPKEIYLENINTITINGREHMLIPVNDYYYQYGKSHYSFYIYDFENDVIIYRLDDPVSLSYRRLHNMSGLISITVMDFNGDGYDDILIELSYNIDFGSLAGMVFQKYEIYFQHYSIFNNNSPYFISFNYNDEFSEKITNMVRNSMVFSRTDPQPDDYFMPDFDYVINLIKKELNNEN